jgi:transposase
MHIVLLRAEGLSPTEISLVLFCSRTTVYAVAHRFALAGRVAFSDRKRRGPEASIAEAASEYIERLVEEGSPTEHGSLRSRWSCKLLAMELFKGRVALVSPETLRRVLHRLGFRWRRPRPIPPEKDSEDYQEHKRRRLLDVLSMVEQAGSFFRDETSLQTNPKVGFCWMRKGKQRPFERRAPTARCGSAGRSTSLRGACIG